MKKAYLGIDIGSISTKGVIIDEEKNILAGIYLWTEGNPMGAAKKVIAALGEKIDQNEYKVVAAGTTGSARKLVGAMCNASIVKNEITAHAVGTLSLIHIYISFRSFPGNNSSVRSCAFLILVSLSIFFCFIPYLHAFALSA